jgi:hypothetical protein
MRNKHEQLGMNPSTASHRLVKDILYRLVIESGEKCFRCGEELTRDTFSIEHKVSWLHSSDPVNLFFDQSNIAFSHLKCNVENRIDPRVGKTKHTEYIDGNREPSKVAADKARIYSKEKRRTQYLRTGK